jgi:hypothetical protein
MQLLVTGAQERSKSEQTTGPKFNTIFAACTQSAARLRILSLAELMARANHIAACRYRIGESAVVLVTTPLLPDLMHCSC